MFGNIGSFISGLGSGWGGGASFFSNPATNSAVVNALINGGNQNQPPLNMDAFRDYGRANGINFF